MGIHGYPRATGDFDIWVEASIDNSEKIYKSLAEFGAPLSDINKKTFSEKRIIFQVGVAPRRIDIITCIDGVNFKDAYKSRINVEVENLKIPFLSKRDLIKNKKSTVREKDKLDIKCFLTKESTGRGKSRR